MKNIIIIAALFVSASLTACYDTEDKYDAPKEMALVGGIEEVYNLVALEDVLYIDPQVEMTDPGDPLEYLWSMYPYEYSTESHISDFERPIVSTDPVLDYPVVAKPGKYTLEVRITNTATRQEIYKTTVLNISNNFTEGWYMLKEIDGATDMDLHRPDNVLMADVIYNIQGKRLPGTPNSMMYIAKYAYLDRETATFVTTPTLNVSTKETFSIIDVTTLMEIYGHDTMFYHGEPKQEESLFSCPAMYGLNYFSDKGVYFTGYDVLWGTPNSSSMFGYVTPITGGCRPNINIINDEYFTYFFDEKNKRILYTDYNGGLYAKSRAAQGGSIPDVDPNNIEGDVLFFGRNVIGSNTPIALLLMQHPTDQAKRTLYMMEIPFYGDRISTNTFKWGYDITGLKLNNATLFANDELLSTSLFYVADNKVYAYRININGTPGFEEPLTLEGLGAGEQITYIKNMYYNGTPADSRFNYLAVGTYSNGNYKVYLYTLTAGYPVGAPVRIMQGEGKVLKMHLSSSILPFNTRANYVNFLYPTGY